MMSCSSMPVPRAPDPIPPPISVKTRQQRRLSLESRRSRRDSRSRVQDAHGVFPSCKVLGFPSSMLISACHGLYPIGYLMMLAAGCGVAAVLLVWLVCIDGGSIGLGAACPPVVAVPPVARLRDSVDGCSAPAGPVRPVRHPRATPGSDTAGRRAPPTSGDIGRAYGCGFRRYRIRRVHARRHRYQAGRHASDIDSGSRGTRGLPISIPRPATDIDG